MNKLTQFLNKMRKLLLFFISIFLFTITFSQNLDSITINNTEGFEINSFQISDNKTGTFDIKLPLFSFHVDDTLIFSDQSNNITNSEFGFLYNKIKIEVKNIEEFDSGKKLNGISGIAAILRYKLEWGK